MKRAFAVARRLLVGERTPVGYSFGVVWWPVILVAWLILPIWVLWQAATRRVD